jgi:hypothetical protein
MSISGWMYEAGKAAFGLKASLCLTCYGGIETAFVVTETARSPSLEAKIHRQYWKLDCGAMVSVARADIIAEGDCGNARAV